MDRREEDERRSEKKKKQQQQQPEEVVKPLEIGERVGTPWDARRVMSFPLFSEANIFTAFYFFTLEFVRASESGRQCERAAGMGGGEKKNEKKKPETNTKPPFLASYFK